MTKTIKIIFIFFLLFSMFPVPAFARNLSYVTHLIPGLDGLGAIGGKAHAPGEFVDLKTLAQQIKRAALLIHRLTR